MSSKQPWRTVHNRVNIHVTRYWQWNQYLLDNKLIHVHTPHTAHTHTHAIHNKHHKQYVCGIHLNLQGMQYKQNHYVDL